MVRDRYLIEQRSAADVAYLQLFSTTRRLFRGHPVPTKQLFERKNPTGPLLAAVPDLSDFKL